MNREQAMIAVMDKAQLGEYRANLVVDAIFALPDPVHEAARRLAAANAGDQNEDEFHDALDALNAALAADPVHEAAREWQRCPVCNGLGAVWSTLPLTTLEFCRRCGGTGTIERPHAALPAER